MIKVHQADKAPYLALGIRLWKISNGLDLILERSNAITVDVMAKKVQLTDTKEAFIRVDDYSIFGEALKYGLYMPEVLFRTNAVTAC